MAPWGAIPGNLFRFVLMLLQDDAGVDHLQALAFLVDEHGVGICFRHFVAQVIDHAGVGANQVCQGTAITGGGEDHGPALVLTDDPAGSFPNSTGTRCGLPPAPRGPQ